MRARTAWIGFSLSVLAVALMAATGFHLPDVHSSGLGGVIVAAAAGAAAVAPTAEDFLEATKALTAANENVKNLAEEARKQMAASKEIEGKTREQIDASLTQLAGLYATVSDLSQKVIDLRNGQANDNAAGQNAAMRSAGEHFVASDDFQKIAGDTAGWRGRVTAKFPRQSFDNQPFRSDVTSLSTSAGLLVVPDRRPGIIELPRRRLTVRNLLAQGRTVSNTIEYVKELLFTSNARAVTEGGLKPQSELTFEDADAPVRTIAHWIRANKQILADAPQLQSVIDARLRYGLELREEAELLRGDGTGQHLTGLMTWAVAYSAPIVVAGATAIDKLRLAILQVSLAGYPADGIVLSLQDWARLQTIKDTTGRYLLSDPLAGDAPKRLWGLPVVDSPALNVDEFLVGNFGAACQIFDREDANVAVSNEDQDNFVRNRVTILAEERLALAVYRAQALVAGDLGFVT